MYNEQKCTNTKIGNWKMERPTLQLQLWFAYDIILLEQSAKALLRNIGIHQCQCKIVRTHIVLKSIYLGKLK